MLEQECYLPERIKGVSLMATDKKPITFYASEKVQKWYQKLPPGTGTQEINRILEEAIAKPKGLTIEQRLKRIEDHLKLED